MDQFNDIEPRIESMEKLGNELEDIHDKIEVKFRQNQRLKKNFENSAQKKNEKRVPNNMLIFFEKLD